MIIDAISDLHGHYPELPGGDALLLGGDYTATNTIPEWSEFFDWLKKQDYSHKVYIAGNHDRFLEQCMSTTEVYKHFLSHQFITCFDQIEELKKEFLEFHIKNSYYILDEMIEIEGIKIYGTPWTKTFEGINPKCKAFTVEEDWMLDEKFKSIPKNVDILVSHGPAMGILDTTKFNENVGSLFILHALENVSPKYFLCGHIHEQGGKNKKHNDTLCFNISHVNEMYEPVNKPLRIYY